MTREAPWLSDLRAFAPAPVVAQPRIAAVIPCFAVSATIDRVIGAIGSEVWRIYCVDDASPDKTAQAIARLVKRDARVRMIRREKNGGVGTAVVDGILAALDDGAEIIVKIDGDGQMNPAFVPDFIRPILDGEADYVKGNRFFSLETVARMPTLRLLGNAGLPFLAKLSTGYWDLFDPTNGYIAINADVARLLPLRRLHERYFFESDLLFRLATLRARVVELPLETVYSDETSHLSELRCLLTFPVLHARNFAKRIFYNHILRGFGAASLNLIAGMFLTIFGVVFGLLQWIDSLRTDEVASAGTVMLSALPVVVGVQLLLSFLFHDVALTPSEAIHRRLSSKRMLATKSLSENDKC